MHEILLSLLLIVPLAAAFIALFIPPTMVKIFRYLVIIANILQVGVLLLILTGYKASSGLQFVEQRPWITLDLGTWGVLKAEYFLGLDGLSMPLVGLAVFVMLIATISSWTTVKNVKGYYILLLILNTAIIGSFTALGLSFILSLLRVHVVADVLPHRALGRPEKRIRFNKILSLHSIRIDPYPDSNDWPLYLSSRSVRIRPAGSQLQRLAYVGRDKLHIRIYS